MSNSDGHAGLLLVTQRLSNSEFVNQGLFNGAPGVVSHQTRDHNILVDADEIGREVLDLLALCGIFHRALVGIQERDDNPLFRIIVLLKLSLKSPQEARVGCKRDNID